MIAGNRYLTYAEMESNAREFAEYMLSNGFNAYAVAGMLGNIQVESGVNPGIWESLVITKNESNGYGLVQWTPASKVRDWLRENEYPLDSGTGEMERIIYEKNNGLQWMLTVYYSMSFDEFAVYQNNSMSDEELCKYLADVWLKNYERPKVIYQPGRGVNAFNWFKKLELGDFTPTPSPEPEQPPEPPPEPPEPWIKVIMLQPNGCAIGYGDKSEYILAHQMKVLKGIMIFYNDGNGVKKYRYIGSNVYKISGENANE